MKVKSIIKNVLIFTFVLLLAFLCVFFCGLKPTLFATTGATLIVASIFALACIMGIVSIYKDIDKEEKKNEENILPKL